MSNFKIALLMIACTIAGGLLVSAMTEAPAPERRVEVVKEYVVAPPSAKAADTEMAFANPLGAPIAAATASSATPPAIKGNELGRALLSTTDVRAFVLDALKRPEQGGGYYATLALSQCADLDDPERVARQIVASDSTISAERQSKITAMVNRCSQLSAGEINALRLEARKLGLEGKDPVMALQIQMTKTKAGTPERDKVIDAMFEGNAAQASMNFVVMRMLQQQMSDGEKGGLVYRLNGKTYTDPSDQHAIDVAASLSLCTGADFCALDAQMIQFCRGQAGICYGSREEYLRQLAYKDDPEGFEKAVRLAASMRDAIARGDRSFFR